MNLSKTYKKVRPAVVSISRVVPRANGTTVIIPVGTGVCIDKDGYILTAYHVVKGIVEEQKDESDLDIVFTIQKHNEAEAMLLKPEKIYAKEELDIAILKVRNYNIIEGRKEIVLLPSLESPKPVSVAVGEDIASIGFPLRTEDFTVAVPDLYKGIVSRVDYESAEQVKNIMLDINTNSGNSGGPVFKANTGELIGIVKGCHKEIGMVIEYDEKGMLKDTENEAVVNTNMVDCIPWSLIKLHYEYIKRNAV